jgi:hypothetical protein
MEKKKKLIDFGGSSRKCAYEAFIIQNLDVVILELSIKIQFANFDKLNILNIGGPPINNISAHYASRLC